MSQWKCGGVEDCEINGSFITSKHLWKNEEKNRWKQSAELHLSCSSACCAKYACFSSRNCSNAGFTLLRSKKSEWRRLGARILQQRWSGSYANHTKAFVHVMTLSYHGRPRSMQMQMTASTSKQESKAEKANAKPRQSILHRTLGDARLLPPCPSGKLLIHLPRLTLPRGLACAAVVGVTAHISCLLCFDPMSWSSAFHGLATTWHYSSLCQVLQLCLDLFNFTEM